MISKHLRWGIAAAWLVAGCVQGDAVSSPDCSDKACVRSCHSECQTDAGVSICDGKCTNVCTDDAPDYCSYECDEQCTLACTMDAGVSECDGSCVQTCKSLD